MRTRRWRLGRDIDLRCYLSCVGANPGLLSDSDIRVRLLAPAAENGDSFIESHGELSRLDSDIVVRLNRARERQEVTV